MDDVAIIGGGAAGLATAIFTARMNPALRIRVLEGAGRPGAKILVSGGSRCNVTNTVVREGDYAGGRPALVKRVLRALPVDATVAFFAELGVALHEEERGKLFPDSNRARDVLDALLRECDRLGVRVACHRRVTDIRPTARGFAIVAGADVVEAGAVVLATGGQSLPKSGSDGAGYGFARAFGHRVTPLTQALTPLCLDGSGFPHGMLSGTAINVELRVWVDDAVAFRTTGAMLFTHFGVSGPAPLDASRHWLQANAAGRHVTMTANLCPAESFEQIEAWLLGQVSRHPRAATSTVLAARVPAGVARAVAEYAGLTATTPLAHLTREARRALVHTLSAWTLPVTGGRGWTWAEATAGGVALDEVDIATMESRLGPGLFLVGEVLDVDGRLGGFNFQWAWSSARVAATGLTRWASRAGRAAAE